MVLHTTQPSLLRTIGCKYQHHQWFKGAILLLGKAPAAVRVAVGWLTFRSCQSKAIAPLVRVSLHQS